MEIELEALLQGEGLDSLVYVSPPLSCQRLFSPTSSNYLEKVHTLVNTNSLGIFLSLFASLSLAFSPAHSRRYKLFSYLSYLSLSLRARSNSHAHAHAHRYTFGKYMASLQGCVSDCMCVYVCVISVSLCVSECVRVFS